MLKVPRSAAAVGLAGALLTCSNRPDEGPRPGPAPAAAPQRARPKLLFIDSYHEGYPWSDGILRGALGVLGVHRTPDGGLDERRSAVTIQIVHMDTKRNPAAALHRKAGQRVKALIDTWRPDLVIAADDNASKHVIAPYFVGARLPFIFCGVNWDASAYGFPAANVTGMIEVSLVRELLRALLPYARGQRIGLLGARNESNQKEADAYRTALKLALSEIRFVDDFATWKAEFRRLQREVDVLLLAPPSFLSAGPDAAARQAEARRFALDNTRIPTGAVEDWIAPYALVTFAKRAAEQGEWAARAALQILAGTPPSQVPIAQNQQAVIFLNMPLARALGARFPVDLVEQATLVGAE